MAKITIEFYEAPDNRNYPTIPWEHWESFKKFLTAGAAQSGVQVEFKRIPDDNTKQKN